MASGKNVATFAVPALRPLVMHLFIRTSEGPPTDELITQREVCWGFVNEFSKFMC